ncbi:hypothetical protein IWQ60_000961 [Tieghemiomyces parasiticus]|uniref:Carrier domain-containing protein n=1 Tax=Tieghemiomyces parasiticus TaxID=78921 RepID=A0A9W8ALW0_9FUNG|nr:hypothetical protein IWQ60_000961 [Tieghemiomyces parasiticus]
MPPICHTDDLVIDMTDGFAATDSASVTIPVRIRINGQSPDLAALAHHVADQARTAAVQLAPGFDPYSVLPKSAQCQHVRVGLCLHPGMHDNDSHADEPALHSVLQHDISFIVDLTSHSTAVTLVYNPDLFESATIQRLGANLLHYCEAVVSVGQGLFEAPLVCRGEAHLLMEEFGRNPSATYDPLDPAAENIVSAFRAAVQKYPDTVALESPTHQETYTSLNAKIEGLARALLALGVRSEDRVAVVVVNNPAAVIIMFAVWLIGAVYVPIAGTLPAERQRYMAAQAGSCSQVVVMTGTEGVWPQVHQGLDLIAALPEGSVHPPLPYNYHPDAPVLVLFTSGTTGHPKGVQINCSNLSNEILAPETSLCPWPGARVFQAASPVFGGFFMNTLSTLRQGGTLVYPGDDMRATLATVDVASMTASLLDTLNPDDYPNLKLINVGGETLLRELADRWCRRVILRNLYGPAEATMANMTTTVACSGKVTIGRPITNAECYIIGDHDQLVPIGFTGEICLGGAGVSGGYVNRPELNTVKFVQLPFTSGRVYKTGDYGRWLPSGEVQYLGRVDDQVKIRGHRVELGEICSTLLQLPDVKKAQALVQDGRLLVFVTPKTLIASKLLAALRATLPEYMLPQRLFCLDDIPLNVNGKANRAELLAYVTQLNDSLDATTLVTAWQHRSKVARAVTASVETVLNLPSHVITADQSFFQLGGDSLSAIRLSTLLRQEGIEAPVPSIFKADTIGLLITELEATTDPTATVESDLPYQPYSLLSPDATSVTTIQEIAAQMAGVKLVDIQDILPVSGPQSDFLINTLKDPTAYMVQSVVEVKGTLDVDRFRRSWEQIGLRHEALRAKFVVAGAFSDHPFLQLIMDRCDFEWSYQPIVSDDVDTAIQKFKEADGQRGFTLAGPLLRLALFSVGTASHRLCVTVHHALLDAWSTGIVLAETMESYHGTPHQDRIQYHSFLGQAGLRDPASAIQYWQTNLDGVRVQPPVQFPVALASSEHSHGTIGYQFSPPLDAIRSYCQSVGVTLNSLLRAVWALTLARYTGSHDEVTFGVLTSGRNLPVEGIEGMVGLCINALPLRLSLPTHGYFVDFLHQVNQTSGALMAYEQCSLVDILRWAKIPADAQLLSSLLVYDNFEAYRPAVANPTVEYGVRTSQNTTEYAYALQFADHADRLGVNIQFQTAHCQASYVQLMSQFMDHCLLTIVTHHDTEIDGLMRLPQSEKALVSRWSAGTAVDFPQKDWLAHQFFTQHLAAQPDAIALESATTQFTYAEVYRRACAITAILRDRGARPGHHVALLFVRCPEFIFGYLAVLLLGGVCVPMDTENAVDRLAYMLDLLDDPWVVANSTTSELAAELGIDTSRLVFADHALTPADPGQERHRLLDQYSPDSLAYIVFTSGTTGRPKGVQVNQRSLANFVLAMSERVRLPSGCRFLQIASLSFDASHAEILFTFHAGGTLVLQDGELVKDLTRGSGCTLVPSVLAVIDPSCYPQLSHIIAAGEALPPNVAAKWSSGRNLHNIYGPSEATIASHYKLIRPGDAVTVGSTLANVQCHILDEQLRPVPIGMPGELCIGGVALSRGYLKQPELTEKAFVPNPLGSGNLYRTGDLGCWLSNGEIRVLGRKDFQVKLRGFRIELGEIESSCQTFPGVANAVAVIKGQHLVAYVTPATIDTAELKRSIATRLPQYMVPTYLVGLDKIPLTLVGKADRKTLESLPLPTPSKFIDDDDTYTSETFTIIRRALIETLDVEPSWVVPSVSILELGGDSLSAIQFAERCKSYGLSLKVSDILKYPRLSDLEQHVEFL